MMMTSAAHVSTTRRVPAPRESRLGVAMRALEAVAQTAASPDQHCAAHAEVAQCLLSQTHDASQAEWHLQQALHWARKGGDLVTAVDLLCRLGATAFQIAQLHERVGDHGRSRVCLNRARDYSFEAVQGLHGMPDRGAEAALLTRIATVLTDCGDGEDAQALLDRARRITLGPAEAARAMDGCPVVSAFGPLG